MGVSNQQPGVSASSEGGLSVGVYATIGAGVVVAQGLKLLPPGAILEAVQRAPQTQLFVAAAAFVGTVAIAAPDWKRAQARNYSPPSARVQLVRALLFGAGLAVTTVVGAAFFFPTLTPKLLSGDKRTAFLFLCAVPYATCAWWLCFRRRTFVIQPLPDFLSAAVALQDSNDFLLGRTGSDWKTGGGDPAWFIVPESGMFANLYCLGGIGSGKTHTVVKPLLEQALFKWPGNRTVTVRGTQVRTADCRVGVFLLDAKGNNAEYVLARAKALGREKDVIVIRPGGEWSINPLAEGNPQALALKLVSALTVMTVQEPNSYYLKMQKEFATNAFGILSDVLGPGRFTMMDLYEFITDSAFQEKFLEAAKPKNSLAYRWFQNQWAKERPDEQMMLTKGFRADLSQFVSDELAPTFCSVEATFPGWRTIVDDGKIVVFSMSLDEWGDFARAMGIFCLMDFQSTILARTTSKFRAEGGNTQRLVMCFADEVWAYMNPKLAEFTAVSREARCCTVALHQGLDQIPAQYRGTMIGNFRTPVVLGINDPLSTETFAKIFGTHKESRETRSQSTGFSGVERQLLSDKMNARAGGESRSLSVSHSEVDAPRFSADEIQRLGKFAAIVQLYDGDLVRTPRVVSLLPGHLNQLG